MKLSAVAVSIALACGALANPAAAQELRKPFSWDNATIDFLMTDRFNNANPANDHA
jgi:alpha-amylase